MYSDDPVQLRRHAASVKSQILKNLKILDQVTMDGLKMYLAVCAEYRRLQPYPVPADQLFLHPVSSEKPLVQALENLRAVNDTIQIAMKDYQDISNILALTDPDTADWDDPRELRHIAEILDAELSAYPSAVVASIASAFTRQREETGRAAVTETLLNTHRDWYRDAVMIALMVEEELEKKTVEKAADVPDEFDMSGLVYASDLVTSGIWQMVPGRAAVMPLDAETMAMPMQVLPDDIDLFFHGDIGAGDSRPLNFVMDSVTYAGSVSRGVRTSYMPHPPAMLYLESALQKRIRTAVENLHSSNPPQLVFLPADEPFTFRVFLHTGQGGFVYDDIMAAAEEETGAFADGFVLDPAELLDAAVRKSWAWIPGRGAVLQIPSSIDLPGSDQMVPGWLQSFFTAGAAPDEKRMITLRYAGKAYRASLVCTPDGMYLRLHTEILDLVRSRFMQAVSAYYDLLISFEPSGDDIYLIHFSSAEESLTMLRSRNPSADLASHPNLASGDDREEKKQRSGGRNAVYSDGFVITDRQLVSAEIHRNWALLATGEAVRLLYDSEVLYRFWDIPGWLVSWFGCRDQDIVDVAMIYRKKKFEAGLVAYDTDRYVLRFDRRLSDLIEDRGCRAYSARRHTVIMFEKTAEKEFAIHFSERDATFAADLPKARKRLKEAEKKAAMPKPVKVSLDSRRVRQAGSDLEETVRLLHTEYDEDDGPAPVIPVPAEPAAEGWAGFAAALTPAETEILQLLLEDPVSLPELKAAAARAGKPLDRLFDSINERAADAVGDVVIEDGALIDEYRSEVAASLRSS